MIGHDQRHAAIAMDAPAQARDRRVGAEQQRRRALAQRDDELRREQLDLALEIGPAGLGFARLRRAVVRAAGTSARWRCRRCAPRAMPSAASMLSSRRPACPTNGSPRASSSAPGASPTNSQSASQSPTPGTVLLRVRTARTRCTRRCRRRTSSQSSVAMRARRASGSSAPRRRSRRQPRATARRGDRGAPAIALRASGAGRARSRQRGARPSSRRMSSRVAMAAHGAASERAAHHERVLARPSAPPRG